MTWIFTYKKQLLLLIIAGTLMLGYGLRYSVVSFSFDSFFAKDNPEFLFQQYFRQQYNDKQEVMFSVAFKSPRNDIFDASFLQQADSISVQIRGLQGIDSMIAGTRATEIRRSGMGIKQVPYFRFETQEEAELSRQKLEQDSSLTGIFITSDKRHICSHFLLSSSISDLPRRDVVMARVDSVLAASGIEYLLSGVPYIRTKYVQKIQYELLIFVSVATLMLIIILSVLFRNPYLVVLPLFTVLVGGIWTYGLMAWSGQAINLVTNLLIPIIFVVGISDIIHITVRYLEELKSGKEKEEAMRVTMRNIGFATFLTSLTTAIGFASLMVTAVPPIRSFGVYGSFGVMATYLICIVFVPNVYLLIPREKLLRAHAFENSPFWDKVLARILWVGSKKSRQVGVVFLAVSLVSLWFTFRIPMDMHLLEELRQNDPTRKAMVFFEERFFGVRPFEMIVQAKADKKITDRESLLAMEQIQNHLGQNPDFKLFISPVTFVKTANYIQHFKQKEHLKIPDSQAEIDELFDFASVNDENGALKSVISEQKNEARIGARTTDLGSETHSRIRADLDSFIHSRGLDSVLSYRYTGNGYITEGNLDYLRKSLLYGLVVVFLTIGLIMGIIYRSWRMLIVSMIPNVVPLLVTAGIMGAAGITLTASAAVVFVVVFGIAVDDTIHFLTHYRLELQNGHDSETAIAKTIMGSGKAIILTSIVLLCGFSTLLFSTFGSTFTIGMFSLITIVFALLSDLYLTPALLRWFGK